MNQGRHLFVKCLTQMRRDMIAPRIDQQVLLIPPGDLGMIPQTQAEAVHRNVIVEGEAVRPILRPLLVDVVVAALEGNGCGKKNDLREADERLDECICGFGRKVIGHFQRNRQIEGSPKLDRLLQIADAKIILGNVQRFIARIGVYSDNFLYSVRMKNLKPSAVRTSEIHCGFRFDQVHHVRHNLIRGKQCEPAIIGVKLLAVGLHTVALCVIFDFLSICGWAQSDHAIAKGTRFLRSTIC